MESSLPVATIWQGLRRLGGVVVREQRSWTGTLLDGLEMLDRCQNFLDRWGFPWLSISFMCMANSKKIENWETWKYEVNTIYNILKTLPYLLLGLLRCKHVFYKKPVWFWAYSLISRTWVIHEDTGFHCRQANKQASKQADRQTDRQTNKHTYIHTHTHICLCLCFMYMYM